MTCIVLAGKSIQFCEPLGNIIQKDALAAVTHRLPPVSRGKDSEEGTMGGIEADLEVESAGFDGQG